MDRRVAQYQKFLQRFHEHQLHIIANCWNSQIMAIKL